ncbi:hypothetical protein BKK51_04620 [Rodentibacter trehalosifermentans]|uniref:Uncharacterized protein n=1 Tax=Rodentibacter trehalosifermentans TaxID=1908263 RepID=A0A1V3IVH9_9PAST|nr:hypothetical protein BKK52_12090 [Rodentibacter trehalosifermentans]OOF45948.1 hypothetical protein BKK51_04620 [Rodentibacter trehalosifermentans]OOF52328.1 hypothetical protein BKK53_05900 [Rodentibacter trehalosifermentans]
MQKALEEKIELIEFEKKEMATKIKQLERAQLKANRTQIANVGKTADSTPINSSPTVKKGA